MRTHSKLRRALRGITVTGLAASGVACASTARPGQGPYARTDFPVNVCAATSQFDPLADLHPGVPVDWLAVRTHLPFVQDGGVDWIDAPSADTACSSATDVPACMAAVGALPAGGWTANSSGFEPPSQTQFVYTRGDAVGTLDTAAALRSFLAPVDSANEAALLAIYGADGLRTYWVDCSATQVATRANGFEIILTSGIACGAGTHRDETRLFVATDGTVTVLDTRIVEVGMDGCAIGRLTEGVALAEATRPTSLGAYLGQMAGLEAAAVLAFERLACELGALGAPRSLVRRAERAARDERRHANDVGRAALRFGAEPILTTDVPQSPRSLWAIALENAAEGCVRETYGAAVATYQGGAADNPELARLLKAISIDETRHAALSQDVAAWLDTRLTDDERASVEAVRAASARRLRSELARDEPDAALRAPLGIPDARTAVAIFDAVFPAVWSSTSASASA